MERATTEIARSGHGGRDRRERPGDCEVFDSNPIIATAIRNCLKENHRSAKGLDTSQFVLGDQYVDRLHLSDGLGSACLGARGVRCNQGSGRFSNLRRISDTARGHCGLGICESSLGIKHCLGGLLSHVGHVLAELLALVNFQNVVRDSEDVDVHRTRTDLAQITISHDEGREGVRFQLAQEVDVGCTADIVELVAVLQVLELILEHEVMSGTEVTTEGLSLFGKAAGPEIDSVDTRVIAHIAIGVRGVGPGPSAIEEVHCVSRHHDGFAGTNEACIFTEGRVEHAHDTAGCRTAGRVGVRLASVVAASDSIRARDVHVCSVGGDEVHQRSRMAHVVCVVHPVDVGVEAQIARRRIELLASRVERRVTDVTTARDIDGAKIQGQTHQVVLKLAGDELVNFVTRGPGNTANDGARCFFGSHGRDAVAVRVLERTGIQESFEETELAVRTRMRIGQGIEVSIVAVDGMGQHRMTEAIHGLGVLSRDRRIDVGVIALEDVLKTGNRRRKFVEYDSVILHLVAEASGLEDAFAVPIKTQRVDGGVGHILVDQRSVGDRESKRSTGQLVNQGEVRDVDRSHGRLGVRDSLGCQDDRRSVRRIAGIQRIQSCLSVGQNSLCSRQVSRAVHRDIQPLVEGGAVTAIQHDPLDPVGQAIVLAVEDGVDGGESNILITAPVTAHEVSTEKFVVIEAFVGVRANTASHLPSELIGAGIDHAVFIRKASSAGCCGVGHIDEEAVVHANRLARVDRVLKVAFDHAVATIRILDHDLRQATLSTGDEPAVVIRREHGHVGAFAII